MKGDSLRVRIKWWVMRQLDAQLQTIITERLLAYHKLHRPTTALSELAEKARIHAEKCRERFPFISSEIP